MSNVEAAEGGACTLEDEDDRVDTSHLDDVEDGCGCTEIWEHLSEQREE